MQLTHHDRQIHLTYCTNIHAGESWDAISSSLEEYIPLVKARLARSGHTALQGRFGIGLRLSGCAASALSEAPVLRAFQAQLGRLGAYVFTINAFPYGPFHGARVKEQVYQPDWRHPARLDFTVRAAHILAQLLPDGVTGSISTVPGAFRDDGREAGADAAIATQLFKAAAELATLELRTGKRIVLALEPEPACFLETVDETLAFFSTHLSGPGARVQFAALAATTESQAQVLLQRHLGVCFDVCHAAVEFEDPVAALGRLRAAGIAVPKIQLSCALRIPSMHAGLIDAVQRLDDGVYLHQVVVRDVGLERYIDLPQALAAFRRGQAQGEWRIHCHVPIWMALNGELESTQHQLRAVLGALRGMDPLPHLEVETYTWDVLPAAFRDGSKADAIARELDFVIKELAS